MLPETRALYEYPPPAQYQKVSQKRMADDRVFDVVLFGYRNDLARAQTLDFLRQLPASESGPLTLDDGSGMPQRLFAALDPERAERVRAELERLGAQVALVPAGQQTTRHVPLQVSSSERRRSAWRLAPALLLLAAVAGIHFRSSPPLVRAVRPVARATAAVPNITAAPGAFARRRSAPRAKRNGALEYRSDCARRSRQLPRGGGSPASCAATHS